MKNPRSVYEIGAEIAKRNWFTAKIFYTLLGEFRTNKRLEELFEEAKGTANSYAHIIKRL